MQAMTAGWRSGCPVLRLASTQGCGKGVLGEPSKSNRRRGSSMLAKQVMPGCAVGAEHMAHTTLHMQPCKAAIMCTTHRSSVQIASGQC